MRDAARAAEMTEEEVALEELKGLAEKVLRQSPTPIFSAATAGGRTTVQTVSAAAKTLPIPQLVKGKSPQGLSVTVQIEQYIFTLLRCTTDDLFFSCCGSVAAHFKHSPTRQPRRKPTAEPCVDNTAKLRPQASVLALRAAGANQLVKAASTTPRSYGRRHRSWHHGHVHATHNERRRGQRPVHHDQVHAWRL
jgi:hypothetical protein